MVDSYGNIMVFVSWNMTSPLLWIKTEFELQRNGVLKGNIWKVSHARLKYSLYICLCIDRVG